MARAPHPLHAAGHASRQTDLDRQVGRADIDSQLETRAGHHGLEPPSLSNASTSLRRVASRAE